jgi:hypothetical protein
MRYYEDGQGFGMIPDGFDPSREVPETADRDSSSPARLAGLFREMDMRVRTWIADSTQSTEDVEEICRVWQEIRQEMGK